MALLDIPMVKHLLKKTTTELPPREFASHMKKILLINGNGNNSFVCFEKMIIKYYHWLVLCITWHDFLMFIYFQEKDNAKTGPNR